MTTADKTSENACPRLLRPLRKTSTLQHSITPLLHFFTTPLFQFLLVHRGAFVDIALWKANLFLPISLFPSVSSAVPGSPFRRLDWAVWECLSPMAQRMKPNRCGFSAVILNSAATSWIRRKSTDRTPMKNCLGAFSGMFPEQRGGGDEIRLPVRRGQKPHP